MEDERIVALFFERSELAIRALDDKYGALCRAVAFNILADAQDAEECVSDAYLGAWNAIPPGSAGPAAGVYYQNSPQPVGQGVPHEAGGQAQRLHGRT